MHDFSKLLTWKLLPGTHVFPGEDGGTCVNEAALVAMGFDYRPIRFADEMPPCFSRWACELALWLNEGATDEQRPRLLPYVTRLACAGTPDVENRRLKIAGRWFKRQYPVPGPTAFDEGMTALDAVLAIGPKAEPLDAAVVFKRLRAAQRRAARAGRTTSVLAEEEVWTSPPPRSG